MTPPKIVTIAELARDYLGQSTSTLYKTWKNRVRDGSLPPPVPGPKPVWSRDRLDAFIDGAAPASSAAKPGRKPATHTRPASRLPIMQRG